jgi:hypothetical protein
MGGNRVDLLAVGRIVAVTGGPSVIVTPEA